MDLGRYQEDVKGIVQTESEFCDVEGYQGALSKRQSNGQHAVLIK